MDGDNNTGATLTAGIGGGGTAGSGPSNNNPLIAGGNSENGNVVGGLSRPMH